MPNFIVNITKEDKELITDTHSKCTVGRALSAIDSILDAVRASSPTPQEIITCGECRYKIDHHYEKKGEEPYIKSTCGCKYGLNSNYQVHDWDYCSRGEKDKEVD